jgi:hypothetical protein
LFNENPNLKIHYITAPSVEGLSNSVLLAVEVTSRVERMNGINPIVASDGKKYQVVGSLGYDKKNEAATTNYHDIV